MVDKSRVRSSSPVRVLKKRNVIVEILVSDCTCTLVAAEVFKESLSVPWMGSLAPVPSPLQEVVSTEAIIMKGIMCFIIDSNLRI
jgi:hypothetical protein